jgi:hypothetical protein
MRVIENRTKRIQDLKQGTATEGDETPKPLVKRLSQLYTRGVSPGIEANVSPVQMYKPSPTLSQKSPIISSLDEENSYTFQNEEDKLKEEAEQDQDQDQEQEQEQEPDEW